MRARAASNPSAAMPSCRSMAARLPRRIAVACAGRPPLPAWVSIPVVARPLRLVGLTGNIGSGKSTVGRLFAARGVPVIDADELLRAVQAPGQPAHADIAAAWPEVVAPDRGIDRKRLGKIVFADPAARKRLEAITHPRIQELSRARAAALAAA